MAAALVPIVTVYVVANWSGRSNVRARAWPLQAGRMSAAGSIRRADSTAWVSISRSNVIVTGPSTGTPSAPSSGSVEAIAGGPTVLNAQSTPAGATLPARSSNPSSTRTVNAVSRGSFVDGVKIALEPSQEIVPGT